MNKPFSQSEFDDARLLAALLRQDFYCFAQKMFPTVNPGVSLAANWHLEAIAWHLMRVARGEERRLLITVPPRSLKSYMASVAFPTWLLGCEPTKQVICVSYSQDLAHSFANAGRSIMESPFYRALFPWTRIDRRKNTESEIRTTMRGERLSTSVGGTLTGRGGDIIIIDDPMKPDEAYSAVRRTDVTDWYRNTLLSRLNDKRNGAIIVVMQRLHMDDLAGFLLEQGGWTHLNLPAISDEHQQIELGDGLFHHRQPGELLHPAREPQPVLDELKRNLGSQVFSAQYQQAPVPPGGLLIKPEWFPDYDNYPCPGGRFHWILSWDTAAKTGEHNDYSVCTIWLQDDDEYYLIDVFRDRLEYPDLRRQIIWYAKQNPPCTILIEDAGPGTSLIQDLQDQGLYVFGVRPVGDKESRLMEQIHKLEAGRVHLPRKASWKQDFVDELAAFPYGRHDDQVDSMVQFLKWTDRHLGNRAWFGKLSF